MIDLVGAARVPLDAVLGVDSVPGLRADMANALSIAGTANGRGVGRQHDAWSELRVGPDRIIGERSRGRNDQQRQCPGQRLHQCRASLGGVPFAGCHDDPQGLKISTADEAEPPGVGPPAMI